MAFRTDKQRKAVMAKLNKGSSRSNINPTFLGKLKAGEKAVAERLRKKFKPTSKELQEQRGARIKKEAKSLESEKLRVQQLELEAKVEAQREALRKREDVAREKLKKIDVSRREKTFAGKILKVEKGLITKGVQAVKKEFAPQKRRKKRKVATGEADFFRI